MVGIAVNLVTIEVEIINRCFKERSEGQTQDPVNDGSSSVGVPSVRNYRAIPFKEGGTIATYGRGQGATPTPGVIRVIPVEVVGIVVAGVVKVVVRIVTMMTSVAAIGPVIVVTSSSASMGLVVVVTSIVASIGPATVIVGLATVIVGLATVTIRLAAVTIGLAAITVGLASDGPLRGRADAIAAGCSNTLGVASHFAVAATVYSAIAADSVALAGAAITTIHRPIAGTIGVARGGA